VTKKKPYRKNGEIGIEPENVPMNPGLISFPYHLGSAVIKPEDKGKIKGKAVAAMKEQTERQMAQLYDQMKVLASQANQIKERIKISEQIYQAQINFEPVIGHIYFLYLKKGQDYVLSMIGPEEWGNELPFKSYKATVKLLSDHTWEILNSNQLDHTSE
jgi:hypothetical protein